MQPIFHRQDVQPHLREALEMLKEVQILQDALQDVLAHDGARSSPAALLELVTDRLSDVEDKLDELDGAITAATNALEDKRLRIAPVLDELTSEMSAPAGAS